MEGWKKLVAGALIGVAGTVYATDEEARRSLPRTARDLPDNLRRRFKGAVSAGRTASSEKRLEILRDLEDHGGNGGGSGVEPGRSSDPAGPVEEPLIPEMPVEPADVSTGTQSGAPEDATRPMDDDGKTSHAGETSGASTREAVVGQRRSGGE